MRRSFRSNTAVQCGQQLSPSRPASPPIRTHLALSMNVPSMADRNPYKDDVEFATLALQSPAFNKQ